LFSLVFSPASALALGLVGYYSLAGFTNTFLPEGNLGGILIRGGILAVIGVALLRFDRGIPGWAKQFLFPVGLFFLAYSLRLVENIYFSDINTSQAPEMIFLTFWLGCIFTAVALARMVPAIHDDQFVLVVSGLCVLFLVGMAFNLDALRETAERRMMLDKINPISMAHLAVAFLFYYMLVFSRSKRLGMEAVIFVPLLLLIMVYAQSRGAILAGGASVVIYLLLLKGEKRIWIMTGLAVTGSAMVMIGGPEKLDIIRQGFERLNSDDPSTAAHLIAWQGAWEQFKDEFAFGRYIIELNTQFYPHNIFLESLMAVGLIGSIPFGIHFVLAAKAAVGIVRSRQFSITAVFIAIMFFRESIAAAGAGSIWGASGFWITSILVITIWYGQPWGVLAPQITPYSPAARTDY